MTNTPRPLPTRRELQFFRDFPWFQAWVNHDPNQDTLSTIIKIQNEIKKEGQPLKPCDHFHAVYNLAAVTYIGYNEQVIPAEDSVFLSHRFVLGLPPLSDQLVKKTRTHGNQILELCSVFADACAQDERNLPNSDALLNNTREQPLKTHALCSLVLGLNRLSWAFRATALQTQNIRAHPDKNMEHTFCFSPENGEVRAVTRLQVITASQARAAAEVMGYLPTT